MQNKNQDHCENNFEKRLHELQEEIHAEKEDIKELKDELKDEEQDLNKLEKKLDDLQKEHHERGHNEHHNEKITLRFIVNGKATEIKEKVDVLLKDAVQAALKKSNNEGRPLSDWNVKYDDKMLDMNKTLEQLKLRDCVELFLSLNAGQGGNQ